MPNMLQSSLGGQVASVGMLVCDAKLNRCRKIWLKLGGKDGKAEEGGEPEDGSC